MTARASAPARLIIGERFTAACARLAGVLVPLDVVARQARPRLCFVVASARPSGEVRIAAVSGELLEAEDSVQLAFLPFAAAEGVDFMLGVFELGTEEAVDRAALTAAVRAAATGRQAIDLRTWGGGDTVAMPNLVLDDGALSVLRVPARRIDPRIGPRTAYGIDAFWCDAHGVYLRGWVHAYEHRVTALRLECLGRSVAVRSFSERPDLVAFFPEHDHVRHGGFAAYLACPPAQPVRAVVETEAGEATLDFVLPEGPLPPWNMAEEGADEDSPRWQLFAELANAQPGPVVQIGARSRERERLPQMLLLRRPVIGFDIHPGYGVNLVADAHALGRTFRPGALGAVFSGSVFEHLEAPWLVAAEINRALAIGGVVYHHAPMAWPAHAQPNDFWRFTEEGLSVLFGEATGFEILGKALLEPAVVLPTPSWRAGHLDMPTVPAYGGVEIVARKVRTLAPGEVSWPLDAERSAERSRQYPVDGLRHRVVPS